MELYEINRFRPRLQVGEIIELSNETDAVELYYKETLGGYNAYFIQLNAKIIGMNKSHRAFRDKVAKMVQELDLKLTTCH